MDVMDKRVDLSKALILHSRPYQESSLIVEVFSRHYGRFSGVVKGGRRKKSRKQGLLQPFIPLLISWQGRTELKTITQVELGNAPVVLHGDAVYSGLYLNELLVKVLYKFDVHEEIFDQYEICLQAISKDDLIEESLRYFERFLLGNLGYGFSCNTEAENNQPIQPGRWYQFNSEQGFLEMPAAPSIELQVYCFKGNEILAIDENNFTDRDVRCSAKRLMRMALAPHLGNEPLKSRAIFNKLRMKKLGVK